MSRLEVSAVVFDLDDTLIFEVDFVASAYRYVASWLGPRLNTSPAVLEARLWDLFDSPDRGQVFNRLLSSYPGNESLLSDCITLYRTHKPSLQLSEEVEATVQWCLANGPVGLVSDGPGDMQAAKAQALGLAERGIHVVLSDSLGGRAAWKPSPLGMLEVCRRMAVPPSSAVYVGDNPLKDFRAARAAGLRSVRLRCDHQLHAQVASELGDHPDLEISSLAQLCDVLTFVLPSSRPGVQ